MYWCYIVLSPGLKKVFWKAASESFMNSSDWKFFETLKTADFGHFEVLPNGRVA